MGNIKSEKRVVSHMIGLYCKHKLKCNDIPDEYKELEAYAHKRLDGCKFGDKKPACKRCPIHCYRADMREKIRDVMRGAGPRMLVYDPIAAIKHLFNK